MNIKRAFKTIDKVGRHYNLYERIANDFVLVTNGHVVITVSNEDFEANKEHLKNLREVDNNLISKIAFDNEDMEEIRLTTVSILCGDINTRVMKSKTGLCVVNEEYIKVLQDVDYNFDKLQVKKSLTGRIRTPLMSSYIDENNNVFCLYAVLPINCNVRDALENILK